jgi:hypothetical protein
MKLKVQVDDDGGAYVAAIDPESGEHRKAATVGKGETLDLRFPGATSVDEVEFGSVHVTGSDQPEPEQPAPPAETPGGGNEGSAEQPPAPPAPDAGSGDQGEGEGAPGNGEGTEEPAPTTSEASEKPLYVISGDEVPGDFEASGLETPGGETLYHFSGDAAGEPGTGNGDAISIYADADDNEQPVQAAAPAEGEAPA